MREKKREKNFKRNSFDYIPSFNSKCRAELLGRDYGFGHKRQIDKIFNNFVQHFHCMQCQALGSS